MSKHRNISRARLQSAQSLGQSRYLPRFHHGYTAGQGVKIHPMTNLYGCLIGDWTKIGAFVEIQDGVSIGKACKISSHSFICTGVTIEEGVFIGHGVMFTNDSRPRALNPAGSRRQKGDWQLMETRVCRGASIGSGATILGGIRIGSGAMIGAGSVVTSDVPDMTVVVGAPARIHSIRKNISFES